MWGGGFAPGRDQILPASEEFFRGHACCDFMVEESAHNGRTTNRSTQLPMARLHLQLHLGGRLQVLRSVPVDGSHAPGGGVFVELLRGGLFLSACLWGFGSV